ncbi:hypothetical protein MMC2321_04673 [Chitinophaga sp. MM2321]
MDTGCPPQDVFGIVNPSELTMVKGFKLWHMD